MELEPEEEVEYDRNREIFTSYLRRHRITMRGEKVLGRDVHIERVENPRVEMDQHYYNPENNKLKKMGVPVDETPPKSTVTLLYEK